MREEQLALLPRLCWQLRYVTWHWFGSGAREGADVIVIRPKE
jgi:hypothetical protein